MIKIFALMPDFGRSERENLYKTEEQQKKNKKKENYNSHTYSDWTVHTCFHNLNKIFYCST